MSLTDHLTDDDVLTMLDQNAALVTVIDCMLANGAQLGPKETDVVRTILRQWGRLKRQGGRDEDKDQT